MQINVWTFLFQRKWMKNTTYLEVNLYLRMLHPLTTTGLAPILILMILNVRITLGIRNMQVNCNFRYTLNTCFRRKDSNSTCCINDKWPLKLHKRRERKSTRQMEEAEEIIKVLDGVWYFQKMSHFFLDNSENSNFDTWTNC